MSSSLKIRNRSNDLTNNRDFHVHACTVREQLNGASYYVFNCTQYPRQENMSKRSLFLVIRQSRFKTVFCCFFFKEYSNNYLPGIKAEKTKNNSTSACIRVSVMSLALRLFVTDYNNTSFPRNDYGRTERCQEFHILTNPADFINFLRKGTAV